MKVSDFHYELPAELIAQRPLPDRDASRLLLLDCSRQAIQDQQFRDLPDLLHGNELLVVNNARVLPARLIARRVGVTAKSDGEAGRARREFLRSPIEVLLCRQISTDVWETLVKPGRKMRTGERVVFGQGELEAEVISRGDFGVRQLRFCGATDLQQAIERLGHIPLPPYIDRPDEPADRERYQTIFASANGAVAAPTAGLHFTSAILERLRAKSIDLCEITLQIGLGTFQPTHCENVEEHRMHRETYEISEDAAAKIAAAHRAGQPILAVGTTVVRALEDAARRKSARSANVASDCRVAPGRAEAEIFIYPGHRFRVVDQMLTNFHLPQSSLLLMVSAFAGREFILRAYRHAVGERYRFYSYGDCMLIR